MYLELVKIYYLNSKLDAQVKRKIRINNYNGTEKFKLIH